MTRPGFPYPAPAGSVWVREVSTDACGLDPDGTTRKCRAKRTPDPNRVNPCNANAVALVRGEYRCGVHLDGRWLEYGVVMNWALEPTKEPEEG